MAWLVEQAILGQPGQNYWWVAPIYPVASIAFERMQRGLPRELIKVNRSKQNITLANETIIWFKGADKPDSLYGEDVFAAVIDEASRCKEEAWHAVRSTLTSTRGPVRCIGNVKGRKNWFWRLCRLAESGAANMGYHRITARDAVAGGVLSQAEIDDARRQLPEDVYKELYEAVASDDAGNPFGQTHIDACIIDGLSDAPPFVWGWDLARGRHPSGDWTVGVGLDPEWRISGFERFQRPWRETINAVEDATGDCTAVIDSSGPGDSPTEELQARRPNQYEAFVFSATSKQVLMEALAVAIQHHKLRFPEGVLAQELRSFEYQYTRTGVRYSAPEGLHDDCVCALGLSVRAIAAAPSQGFW